MVKLDFKFLKRGVVDGQALESNLEADRFGRRYRSELRKGIGGASRVDGVVHSVQKLINEHNDLCMFKPEDVSLLFRSRSVMQR